jgi:type I restriction enzyme S subunit
VDQERKVITEAKETRRGDSPSRARQLVKAGEILVSTVRPNLNGVAQVSSALDGATASTEFCAPRPEIGKVSPRYLMQWVKSPAFIGDMVRKATGASYPAVSDRIIGESLIPLPSLDEQRRIADILDRADALRAKRRAALARLDELTQAIFVERFGEAGKDTRWANRPLGSFVSETNLVLVRGATERSPKHPYSYVRMNAITRGGELDLSETHRAQATQDELRDYALRPGDCLFNTRNSEELVGKTALYEGQGIHLFNNNILRMRFAIEADPVYVAACFRTRHDRHELSLRKSGTTNVFAIYWKDLRSLPVPLPPIQLQREFSIKANKVKRLLDSQRHSLSVADTLFASLQDRAFQGAL